jgi:AAA+ ATPase superfamily predicted ATPase
MMIRIFEHNKEPLFGRASSKLNVGPFRPSILKTVLAEHNPDYDGDDLLFLYMVTGGVPRYIELLIDSGAVTFEKMVDRICAPDSHFLTDGRDLLISEFGKDHGTYFSILQLIANGKNTLREISDSTGKDCGAYLEVLSKEYGIIRKNRPVFSKDNSRNTRWQISDNYLKFYFRFISSSMSAVEFGRYDLVKENIISGYPQYSGKVLEDYFKEKIAEEERFTRIGSHWDRKGQNEIDIVVLDDPGKRAVVAEVKRNPDRAGIGSLKRRTETIPELNGYSVEYRILSQDDM